MSLMFQFKAADLLRKFGFGDGGVLDDLLERHGYDISAHRDGDEEGMEQPFGGAVLCECVRRRLIPVLPSLEIDYNASLSHNPVRLWNEKTIGKEARALLGSVSVEVSESQVLAVAAELEPSFPTARISTPSPSV